MTQLEIQIQRFHLVVPDVPGVMSRDVDDNLSVLPREDIKKKMMEYIARYGLAPEGRYVAVGDAGDCIIYNAGEIDLVSDSG